MSRERALDDFYGQLDRLARQTGGPRELRNCSKQSGWPERGLYFFFEAGEFRSDGTTPRVVRVGTHGLRPSKSTLWGRLSQHRGTPGGSLPGGGNHRGSIFRLHVGSALAASRGGYDIEASTWARGGSAPRATRVSEYRLERAVTEYLGSMPFLWLEVSDSPSSAFDRGVIESGAIGLLSNFDRPDIDPPSESWLGRSADREVIRASGLWNVNHVKQDPEPGFLDVLARWVSISA